MKFEVKHYDIVDNHILATPKYTKTSFIEAKGLKEVCEYLETQTDMWGHTYKMSNDRFMGFDMISNQGAVKIETYAEYELPEFRKI